MYQNIPSGARWSKPAYIPKNNNIEKQFNKLRILKQSEQKCKKKIKLKKCKKIEKKTFNSVESNFGRKVLQAAVEQKKVRLSCRIFFSYFSKNFHKKYI